MRGTGDSSRGDDFGRPDVLEADVKAAQRAAPPAQSPSVLQEPAIRELEERKVALIGRKPWHDGRTGLVEWNEWANDVRRVQVQVVDIGDVASATIVRVENLAKLSFDD
jgi:hypothetical protein